MRGVSAALFVALALTAAAVSLGAQTRGAKPAAKPVTAKNPVAATPASIKAGTAGLQASSAGIVTVCRAAGDGPLAPTNPKPANLTDAKWEYGSS